MAFLVAVLAALTLSVACHADIILATFDGAAHTTWNWRVMNDPVMGGISVSNATINTTLQAAVWEGQVRIVPSLKAPGFCNYETTNGITTKFNDASPYSHLLLRVRSSTPSYAGYKVSFAADTLDRQFKSFKANFELNTTEWTTVAIPFTQFSKDWSSFTGDCNTTDPTGQVHHCCSAAHPEVCPTKHNLRDISQLGLWTEGASGDFHLEILWIGAGNAQQSATGEILTELPEEMSRKHGAARLHVPTSRNTCKYPVQHNLRYNISGRLGKDYLPLSGLMPLESLAFAVCCDRDFQDFAEPQSFFAEPDVNLFGHLNPDGQTIFYDTTCGLPVFVAPVNRTLADFKQDTTEHTWPSFRVGEAIMENIVINATSGAMFSKCGTHLGSYDPDARGPRYCIDLSCISGNPAKSVLRA